MGNTTSGSTKSTEETKVFNLVVDTLHLKFDEATGQFTERDDDNKNNDDATGIVMFGRDPMIKYLSSINDPASFEKFVAEITKYSNGDENVSGVGISAYVDKLQLDFNRSMVVLLDTTKDDQLTDITISDTKKQSPTSIASETISTGFTVGCIFLLFFSFLHLQTFLKLDWLCFTAKLPQKKQNSCEGLKEKTAAAISSLSQTQQELGRPNPSKRLSTSE